MPAPSLDERLFTERLNRHNATTLARAGRLADRFVAVLLGVAIAWVLWLFIDPCDLEDDGCEQPPAASAPAAKP
jgi:hypothetical protein